MFSPVVVFNVKRNLPLVCDVLFHNKNRRKLIGDDLAVTTTNNALSFSISRSRSLDTNVCVIKLMPFACELSGCDEAKTKLHTF